jgi:hypothetical protein
MVIKSNRGAEAEAVFKSMADKENCELSYKIFCVDAEFE